MMEIWCGFKFHKKYAFAKDIKVNLLPVMDYDVLFFVIQFIDVSFFSKI